MGIPAEIFEAAAKPARQRFDSALERLPKAYRPLVTEMRDRLFEPKLDMEDLWARHGLNEKNHSKALTRALGEPACTFARRRKAETAGRLLADERIAEVSVATIALASGFNSSSALTAAFKPWSRGLTPSEYRRAKLAEAPAKALVQLEEHHAPVPAAEVHETLLEVYRLAMEGDCDRATYETALGKLGQAAGLVERHTLPDLATDVMAHRGLVHHCHACDRVLEFDLDGAYADLAVARTHYAVSPRLPKRIHRDRDRLLYPDDTTMLLLRELCVPCRAALLAEEGRSVREHLGHALEPLPKDLEWFQGCCGPCYRAIWEAVDKARLGLIDDAWKAVWLAAHAHPVDEAPPSLARFVRALYESQVLTHKGQGRRLELCRLAVRTARELGDSLREAYALCFVANALRAMGYCEEAWSNLRAAKEGCQGSPWAAAFQSEVEGCLVTAEGNRQVALARFGTAKVLFSDLDPHLKGRILLHEGELLFHGKEYEAAGRTYEEALSALDHPRDPLLAFGLVPLNLASVLWAQGRTHEAKATLRHCEFDRSVHVGGAANELFVSGCIALEEGVLDEALEYFNKAADILESLDRPRDKALAIAYSVEAHARLGNREQAVESAAEALCLFQALGCQHDSIDAFDRVGQRARIRSGRRRGRGGNRPSPGHGGRELAPGPN